MTTAGEAASLFGGADSADDPFSLVAQDDHETSGNNPFADLGPPDAAADLFDFAAHNAAGTTAVENYVSHDATGYVDQAAGWGAASAQNYAYEAPQAQYNHTQAETYPTYPATNGWNDVSGQWAGHDNQQQYGAGKSLFLPV